MEHITLIRQVVEHSNPEIIWVKYKKNRLPRKRKKVYKKKLGIKILRSIAHGFLLKA